MSIKTFNVDENVYATFSGICKSQGISMSKQVELFMKSFNDEEPKARKEYLARLEKIRKGKFIKVNNFAERYKVQS